MKKRFVSKGIVLMFLLGLISVYRMPSAHALLLGTEFQITTDPNTQWGPQIDGDYIVYTDSRAGNNDVYLYNITSGEETSIADSTEDEYFNDISGDLVVYTLSRFDDDDIHVYNITSGETRQITDPENREFTRRRNPAIHGTKVVWQDKRSGNYDIYCYDLTTDTEFIVSLGTGGIPQPGNQMYPKIHGSIVVWEDDRDPDNPDIYFIDISNLNDGSTRIPADERLGLPPDVEALQAFPDIYERYVVFDEARRDDINNRDIVLWDLDTDTAIWKTVDPRRQSKPRIDRTRIVWEDTRNDNIDIYTYDLATGEMDPVVTDPSMQFLCDVSGDRIVWTDLRNVTPENPANYDIYMFEREAPTPPPSPPTITETQITTNTADQMYPDIYGDLIVWQDHRNGNADIYLGEISFAAPPSLSIEQAERIRSIIADPSQIPRSDFDGANDKVRDNRRNALLNKLDAVIHDIQTAEAPTDPSTINTAYQSAIDQLNSMLAKTDGCAERGTPDTEGSGYTPDWIITCETQALIDPLIRDLIATLEALLIP